MLKQGLICLTVATLLIACSGSSDDSGSANSALYDECSTPTQCQTGLCLTLKQNLQNKTGLCTQTCNDDPGCAGGQCVDLPPGIGGGSITKVCLASCTTDADCKNGFACVPNGGGNVCLVRTTAATPTSCAKDADCTEAKAKCITGATSGAKACTHALDAPDVFERECTSETIETCPGLTCLTLKANAQNKGGICTMTCTEDADCPNASCVDFGVQKICLGNCTGDSDCKNGYVCVDDPTSSTKKYCLVNAN